MEKTLVILKPDCVLRGFTGKVISRLEERGLKITAMKMMKISEKLAKKHYEEHREKPFFPSLIKYITMAPVVLMVVEGWEAIKIVREISGKTNPLEASAGSIRGDFGIFGEQFYNVIHASDSAESAEREVNLFFSEDEIHDYDRKWS